MRSLRPCVAPLLVFGLACSAGPHPDGSDAGSPCGSCPDGQACEAATKTCLPALAEGQACGVSADAGSPTSVCATGLTCGWVGALRRCSKDCTAQDATEVCGVGRKCFARPGSSDGVSTGYCAQTAGEGQRCADAELIRCSGASLVCVSGATGAGTCFALCDPTLDADPACSAGESCSDLWYATDPAKGICVHPVGHFPCDPGTLAFCGRGEVCVQPEGMSGGYCHGRCSSSGGCKVAGEACTHPLVDLAICAVPIARCLGKDPSVCATCSAASDRYCGPGDRCVGLGDFTVCKQECTGGQSCAAGTCSRAEDGQLICLE